MTTEIKIDKDGDVTIKTDKDVKIQTDDKKSDTKESVSTNNTKILLTEG